eukprot:3727033-Prymnesium_polylepis.1
MRHASDWRGDTPALTEAAINSQSVDLEYGYGLSACLSVSLQVSPIPVSLCQSRSQPHAHARRRARGILFNRTQERLRQLVSPSPDRGDMAAVRWARPWQSDRRATPVVSSSSATGGPHPKATAARALLSPSGGE